MSLLLKWYTAVDLSIQVVHSGVMRFIQKHHFNVSSSPLNGQPHLAVYPVYVHRKFKHDVYGISN